MSKPSLTTAEIEAQLNTLYLLSDSELINEADAMAADFSSWMKATFALTPEQIEYIDGAPVKVQKYWGYVYAATLSTRGPIVFPIQPNNPVPRRAKETRQNLFGEITYNNDEKELVGSLNTEITFTLL